MKGFIMNKMKGILEECKVRSTEVFPIVDELCGHCSCEQEIPNGVASDCKECGEMIVPCASCPAVTDSKDQLGYEIDEVWWQAIKKQGCDWCNDTGCSFYPIKEDSK